jgi:hypothetical protein
VDRGCSEAPLPALSCADQRHLARRCRSAEERDGDPDSVAGSPVAVLSGVTAPLKFRVLSKYRSVEVCPPSCSAPEAAPTTEPRSGAREPAPLAGDGELTSPAAALAASVTARKVSAAATSAAPPPALAPGRALC